MLDCYKKTIQLEINNWESNGYPSYSPSSLFLNDSYVGRVIGDLNRLSFNHLYPNLIFQLYSNGFIDLDKETADILEYFLSNSHLIDKNSSEYLYFKSTINSIYGKLDFKYVSIMQKYLKLLYDDVLSDKNNNIVYLDCDIIYYIGDLNLHNLSGFKHDVISDVISYFVNLKKYYQYINGSFRIIGLRMGNSHESNLIEKIRSEFTKHLRNKKLEELL